MKTTADHSPTYTDATTQSAAAARAIETPAARALAGVFKSLSDPTRLRIISVLRHGELCVADLTAALGMEQSTISHQLRHMRSLGLVGFRREGRRIFYHLDDPHVRSLFDQGLAHSEDR